MTKGKDYEVGYGKPPKHSQFQPGRSGNPAGRKAGARGLKTDLITALEATDAFLINGKRVEGTNQQLMLDTLSARGARGDIKASALLLPLILNILGSEDRGGGRPKMSANDQAILDEVLGAYSSPVPDDPQMMLPPPEATDRSYDDDALDERIEGGENA